MEENYTKSNLSTLELLGGIFALTDNHKDWAILSPYSKCLLVNTSIMLSPSLTNLFYRGKTDINLMSLLPSTDVL
jgi:hypothetical protein